MRAINPVKIKHNNFFTAHKNHLLSILGDAKISDFGGVEFPRTYTIYFPQNPEMALQVFSESNKSIIPSKSVVNTLLHTDTINDIPWIHSNIGKVKKVLITDAGFGELISAVNDVYKNPNIDVIVRGDLFSKELIKKFSNATAIVNILESVYNRAPYDAIFIGKYFASQIDYSKFKTTFYDNLSHVGEIIMIIDSEDFKAHYESYDEFRSLFNQFGYASSIKNIGSYGKDLILHFRKQSPDYSAYEIGGEQYPNIYVHSLISKVENDPILHMNLKKYLPADRESALYKLIYDLRIFEFMYLPKVEEHIEFINNHIENYSMLML